MKTIFILPAILFLCVLNQKLTAVSSEEEIINKLPKIAGSSVSNSGKEFWFSVPPCYDQVGGSGNFIKLFVISTNVSNVKVEIPKKGYSKSQTISPNVVSSWDLNPGLAQPFVYDYTRDKYRAGENFPGSGIHVISDSPIILYCMVRFQYTSDGWCCIPINELGRDYVVASYYDYDWPGGRLPAVATITAISDSTHLQMTFEGTASSSMISAMDGIEYHAGENVPMPLMNKGDVYCFMATGFTGGNDITGTRITSDNPVAVNAGVYCAWVPVGNTACDYIGEFLLPTESWGTAIHVPQVYDRRKPGIIRIFAKEAKTTIFRDGAQIGYLTKGTGLEGSGWLEKRVVPEEQTPRPAFYTSDKQFNIVYYNPGQTEDNVPSDPFEMSLTPVELYQNSITFCTPRNTNNPADLGFSKNFVDIVYELDNSKKTYSDFQIGKYLGKKVTWTNIVSKYGEPDYVFTTAFNGKWYGYKHIPISDGIYVLNSPSSKITSYLYGFGSYDSYGYPANSNISSINYSDSLPPVLNYNITKCGDIINGTVVDYPNPDPSNSRSNLFSINLRTDSSSNYELTNLPFDPGKSSTTTWNLKVIDYNKDGNALVEFMDNAGNQTNLTITYSGKKINVYGDDFNLIKGNSKPVTKIYQIVNQSKQPIIIDELKLEHGNQNFSIVTPLEWNIKDSISAGDKRYFSITFDPYNLKVNTTYNDAVSIKICGVFKNYTNVNATVTENKYLISGKVNFNNLGIDGVIITNGSLYDTTKNGGFYTLSSKTQGNFIVYPISQNYIFQPQNYFVNLVNDTSGFDFTATGKYIISGKITSEGKPLENVTVSNGFISVKSDINGVYKFTNMPAIAFDITPNMANYSFIPQSKYVNLTSDVFDINFFAISTATYTISGRILSNGVGLDGIIVNNSNSQKIISNNGGLFSFANLPKGTYTITPTLQGYAFNPKSIIVNLAKDTNNIDFSLLLSSIFEENINNNIINVVPNPAETDYVTIKLDKILDGNSTIKIRNILGIECMNLELNENSINEYNLNIKNLTNGIYFLQLLNKNEKFVTKFEVKR